LSGIHCLKVFSVGLAMPTNSRQSGILAIRRTLICDGLFFAIVCVVADPGSIAG